MNAGYKSALEDDEFLQALAKGGIQVGELAKLYHPGGVDIDTLDSEEALRQTSELLERENVTIYEAAVRYSNCLVRVDVLEKRGNRLNLIEVKSKSWDPDESFVSSRSGFIKSGWQKYLFDVAFQSRVLREAFPGRRIEPYLMLIDKSRQASVDGLHQMFRVVEDDRGRYGVKIKEGVCAGDLGEQILRSVHVGEWVEQILSGTGREPQSEAEAEGFGPWVETLSRHMLENRKYPATIGAKCKKCEFRVSRKELGQGEKSGFEECWREALGWSDKDFDKPHIFDIWDERGTQKILDQGVCHMEELIPGMLPCSPERVYEGTCWDRKQRQTVQIMTQTGRHEPKEIIMPGLFEEMAEWKWPLHFIDFEAVLPAIPFHKGLRPYEYIPFQFSCHTAYEDGRVEHRREWIEKRPGVFPCFEFARQLKACLKQDEGTVFRYHDFENTVLNKIAEQLRKAGPDDADELIEWTKTLTKGGEREMVDQYRLVRDYYYSPYMAGSNSIKAVLPAVLNESQVLKEIYSKPYSGLSLKEKVLYSEDRKTGLAISPYKLLDPVGYGLPDYETGDRVELEDGRIAEGGTAMMAWSRIQFDDIDKIEREAILKSLLEYCELDTLAMVMIWQHWVGLANSS
ncbi:MAG: DUF2779 domain-containing protein [Balneolaceae bacterium]